MECYLTKNKVLVRFLNQNGFEHQSYVDTKLNKDYWIHYTPDNVVYSFEITNLLKEKIKEFTEYIAIDKSKDFIYKLDNIFKDYVSKYLNNNDNVRIQNNVVKIKKKVNFVRATSQDIYNMMNENIKAELNQLFEEYEYIEHYSGCRYYIHLNDRCNDIIERIHRQGDSSYLEIYLLGESLNFSSILSST